MSRTINSSALPAVMRNKLRSIRRRSAVLAVIRAIAIGASVLLVTMTLAMIADWSLTLFSTGVRTTLTASSLVLAAAALLVAGILPLVAALGWTRAAADVDHTVRQLEERWTTVATLAASEQQPASPTARAMLQQVTSEAAALGELVRPQQVAKPAAVRSAMLTLAGCALLLTGFLAVDWPQTSVLLRRFWSPTAEISATRLRSVTGDVEIPRGESLELITELSGLPRDTAVLTVQYPSNVVDVFELKPDPERVHAFVHPMRADTSFRYRVQAGDGRTEWHEVTAIDEPKLADVRFTITAPDYLHRPPYEKRLIPRRVKVAQGSRLELQLKPTAELERLELALSVGGDADEPTDHTLTLTPDADGWYRFEAQLLEDILLRPVLFGPHGLTSTGRHLCRIQVVPDKPPVARITRPADELAVADDDVIDIEFEAHDDHGIARAELVVYDESKTEIAGEPTILSVREIPLDEARLRRHAVIGTKLDLKQLDLQEGARISYAVRVTDNRNVQIEPDALTDRATLPSEVPLRRADGAGTGQNANRGDRRDTPKDAAGGVRDADGQSRASKNDLENALAALSDPGAQQGRGVEPKPRDSAEESHSGEKVQRPSSSPREHDSRNGSGDEDRRARGNPDDGASNDNSSPGDNASPSAESAESPKREATVGTNADPGKPDKSASTQRDPSETENNTSTAAGGSNDRSVDEQDAADARGATQSAGDSLPDKVDSDSPQKDDSDDSGRPAELGPANDAGEAGVVAGSEDTGGEASAGGKAPVPGYDPADGTTSAAVRNESETAEASNQAAEPDTPDDRSGGSPPPVQIAMTPQQVGTGQNAETGRRTLKITQRLTAVAAARNRRAENMQIRDRIVAIDKLLADAQTGLTRVVERQIPDADRGGQLRILDQQLGDVEAEIAELRNETKEDDVAFVGLQMVDIGRSHVTPARDRVFEATRDLTRAVENSTGALGHVVRTRELLAALLSRYDRVVRDRELAESLEQTVKIYEVYVEKMHKLMRERRQTMNPLQRKMAVIEVDQEYLDRYAEVLKLRREMLSEFARMLGDDPRLLARYLDLVKRRRTSLRDRLSKLAERQEDLATELGGWQAVDEARREDLWRLIVEMRLGTATQLAKDAAALAERIEKQMPLVLEAERASSARVIAHAEEIALAAREITFDTRRLLRNEAVQESEEFLHDDADSLVRQFAELDAALDRLAFKNEDEEEVADYVNGRLLESRTVADQAEAWARLARCIENREYHGMAEVDQHKLAIATELLRVEMLDFEEQLESEFQQQAEQSVPAEIVEMIRELHGVMEAVTFNQAAATFAAANNQLAKAERGQARALEGFARAEELFDEIRRAVADGLDEYDVPDPDIAELRDPTLDRFLAQLEREPNIEAQLGIPNRPRNLRVIADTMIWEQENGVMLGDSAEAAWRRASEAMKRDRVPETANTEENSARPPAVEEDDQRERAKEMQQMLEKSLAAIRRKADEPDTSAKQRRKLQQMAQNIQRMLEQMRQPGRDARAWERIAQSDQAAAILRALAQGEAIPDQQWNKLVSTLDDGLWQVRGKSPPEEYRKAIEQYQDRIRELTGATERGAE